MSVRKILPDPKWKIEEIVNHDLITDKTFFVGCVSFEDRCKTALKKMLPVINQSFPITFIEFKDDECTDISWKKKCDLQTNENWTLLERMMQRANIKTNSGRICYSLFSRSEDILKLEDDLRIFKKKNLPEGEGLRVIFDFSCIPSYFAFQLLKHLIEDKAIHDLIILYTKPLDYPTNEALKKSPPDKTKPDFLPAFGIGGDKVKWVVGLGFDYNSVKNAERIKDSLKIEEEQYVLVPFPGYEPEYVYRTFYENKKILEVAKNLRYVPADNPFQTFELLCTIIKDEKNFILSSFGPKPIGLGMTMAAVKLGLPILHVQAISYNPAYSSGEGDTLAYWVKYRGKCWWEY